MNGLQKQETSCSKILTCPSPSPRPQKFLSLFCVTGCYKKERFLCTNILCTLGTKLYRDVTYCVITFIKIVFKIVWIKRYAPQICLSILLFWTDSVSKNHNQKETQKTFSAQQKNDPCGAKGENAYRVTFPKKTWRRTFSLIMTNDRLFRVKIFTHFFRLNKTITAKILLFTFMMAQWERWGKYNSFDKYNAFFVIRLATSIFVHLDRWQTGRCLPFNLYSLICTHNYTTWW